MMSERRTITIEDWAKAMGIARNTAYGLAREGKLPGLIRLGRRMVISRELTDELLAKGQAQQPAAPAGK